eukprot:CAMPEP_0194398606 /NCGR_PEP_ID=MMETSP0174-20130528/126198_1 /TAXON_ID=216777 /ORGANISM="Proboscia alata, Strain PI-D3" /LENGTH=1091 /DNA_ID=CAMNT_0039194923 /DNA_START=59 /DNA_END=3332 /DNA_ORIENTATION=+
MSYDKSIKICCANYLILSICAGIFFPHEAGADKNSVDYRNSNEWNSIYQSTNDVTVEEEIDPNQEYPEEVEDDVETWTEIIVTLVITIISTVVFLIVFEVCRRLPAVEAVFDRRRSFVPKRTPPPLMRHKCFEWIFLKTDSTYQEYAGMVARKESIKQKKLQEARLLMQQQKQQSITSISVNSSHSRDNINSTIFNTGKASIRSLEKIVEEGESSFNKDPKYKNKKQLSEQHKKDKKTEKFGAKVKENAANTSPSHTKYKNCNKEEVACSNDTEIDYADKDNFDEQNPSIWNVTRSNAKVTDIDDANEIEASLIFSYGNSNRIHGHPNLKSCMLNDTEIDYADKDNFDEQNPSIWNVTRSNAKVTDIDDANEIEASLIFSYGNSNRIHGHPNLKRSSQHKRRDQLVSSPSAVMINGRRLPSSIANRVIAGELTEQELDELELRQVRKEQEAEEQALKIHQEASNEIGDERRLGVPPRFALMRRNPFGMFYRIRRSSSILKGLVEDTNLTSKKCKALKPTSYLHRHLSSAEEVNKRPLTSPDQELLRCVGLDTFVMIRFLRFGFDVTFYPFLLACCVLLPTYYTSNSAENSDMEMKTFSYFRFTMQRIEPGSSNFWVPFAFAVFFNVFLLWRLWVEWETFITLRFEFLANGDPYIAENKEHLHQYQTSCLVEFVPDSHRRDKELYEYFDALFPGQVKRAEVLLNATKLTKLIEERKAKIIMYENLYAKQFHAKAEYRKKMESHKQHDASLFQYLCCWCLGFEPKKPKEPKTRLSGYFCRKKLVKALPYYLSEIKRLNRLIEDEHRRIILEKAKSEDKESQNFLVSNIVEGIRLFTGTGWDLTCDTGFVQFHSLTAKQSAIQCNITGTTNFMVTSSAPDPRDMVWENSTVERSTIKLKKLQCDTLLLTGTLFWSAVLAFVTSISKLSTVEKFVPPFLVLDPDNPYVYGLIQGYLPVVLLELLMLVFPIFLRFIAENYIRFKTKSQVDKFVFTWHFGYRFANLLIILVSASLYDTLKDAAMSPASVIKNLADGISVQSQFFLNNLIIQAGTENFFELAQGLDMAIHFIMHRIITVEAKSRRYLEKLEEPNRFQW